MAVELGQQVEEEERIVLAALSPVKDDGLPAGLEAGIIAGRRQIKSWAMEMLSFYEGWILELPQITWTAHLTRTSDANFRHMVAILKRYRWLREPVARWYEGNGNHSIVFKDGRRIDFIARQTGKSGRGEGDINRLILDEWLYGTEAMAGAMIPAMGAATNRYVRYASSPGLLTSGPLRQIRERGRRGGDPSLAYIEYTSERVVDGKRVVPTCLDPECLHLPGVAVGCILDDQAIIRANNPAYGRRLTEEFVSQERLALSPVEFGRERAGIWEDPPTGDSTDDTLAKWSTLANPAAKPTDPLALALDVSHDSRSAALVVVGNGVAELVDYRIGQGTDWVPGRVVELIEKHSITAFGVAMSGPVKALLPKLPEDTVKVPSGEADAACIALAQDVQAGTIGHRGQPALDMAAARAVRQLTGDGWRWSRAKSAAAENGCDISPLWALVIAHHLAATAPKPYDPLANFMPNL